MKKSTKYLILGVVVLGGILLFTYGFSFARYVSNSIWNHYLQAKGFYFESDTLNDTVVNNIWDGSSIYFDVKNNLNELVATEYDITYQVTCNIIESDVSSNCYINGTNSNTYTGTLSSDFSCINETDDGVIVTDLDQNTCQMQGYRYVAVPAIRELYFDITGDVTDVKANITVTSISPYSKTLSSDFILHKDQSSPGDVLMNYNRLNNHNRLVITNSYNEDKCVTISWDASKLRIDEDITTFNSYQTDSDGYINQITVTIDKKNSLSYIFYEVAEASVDDFSITESTC